MIATSMPMPWLDDIDSSIFDGVGREAVVHGPGVFLQPWAITLGPGVRVDSFVKVEGGQQVRIGAYVHVASFAHLNIGGGTLLIGAGAAIASGARILSGSNNKAGISMSAAAPAWDRVIQRGKTVLEECCFIGAGATVLPGVRVGRGAVVGAGAVVTHDVPPWQIWAGCPAKCIGTRQESDSEERLAAFLERCKQAEAGVVSG